MYVRTCVYAYNKKSCDSKERLFCRSASDEATWRHGVSLLNKPTPKCKTVNAVDGFSHDSVCADPTNKVIKCKEARNYFLASVAKVRNFARVRTTRKKKNGQHRKNHLKNIQKYNEEGILHSHVVLHITTHNQRTTTTSPTSPKHKSQNGFIYYLTCTALQQILEACGYASCAQAYCARSCNLGGHVDFFRPVRYKNKRIHVF